MSFIDVGTAFRYFENSIGISFVPAYFIRSNNIFGYVKHVLNIKFGSTRISMSHAIYPVETKWNTKSFKACEVFFLVSFLFCLLWVLRNGVLPNVSIVTKHSWSTCMHSSQFENHNCWIFAKMQMFNRTHLLDIGLSTCGTYAWGCHFADARQASVAIHAHLHTYCVYAANHHLFVLRAKINRTSTNGSKTFIWLDLEYSK